MPRSNRSNDSSNVLQRLDSLPTLPVVALRVGELVHDPSTSARHVAGVMKSDPSLCAKVLKLVNSPYYGIPGGVSDVERSISFIGFNTLHQLVLSVSVLQALSTPKGVRFDARGLWIHSLAVGSCARVIAEHLGYSDSGACFTAGLLHDVGKIALAKTDPDRFGQALDRAHHEGFGMAIAEKEVGLPSHDKVGNILAKRWKFPAKLMMPIAHHHKTNHPSVQRGLAPSLRTIVEIVSLADSLCRTYELGDSGSPAPEEWDDELLDRLGLTRRGIDGLYSQLMRDLEVSKVFLQLLDS